MDAHLSHDPPCTWCGHPEHHYLPCEQCPCEHGEIVGVDTALSR